MSKNYLALLIIAIFAASGFFAVSRFLKKEETMPLIVDIGENTKEPEKIEEVNNKVENISPSQKTKTEGSKKLPSPPSVDRPINVISSVSGAEKDEIIEQIKHFSASLRNKPENLHEWIQLGNLYKILGDYLGAVEYWKYASVLEPTYHVPYNNLGNLYQFYLNDLAKAEEYFKKMIEVSPNNEESYRNLFELYANSYTKKENLAIGVLEEGIKNVTHNQNLKMMLENYKSEKGLK